MSEDLEACAARLEASGEYKVLRKLSPRPTSRDTPEGARLGVVLDVETTGMDLARGEVIELAMARFVYTPEGEVLGVHETFHAYHEPSRPISPEITALTGIDAETVARHKLDVDAVGAFVAPAVIVLAHNAAFDRRFAERLHPYFTTKAWGCTMNEPPWRDEGFQGLKLAHLAAQCGFFYDRHRALHDCMATLEIHASPALLPATGARGSAWACTPAQLAALGHGCAVRAQGAPEGPRLSVERRGEWQPASQMGRRRRRSAGGGSWLSAKRHIRLRSRRASPQADGL